MTDKTIIETNLKSLPNADLYTVMLTCDEEISEFSGRAKAWQILKNKVTEELQARFVERREEYKEDEQKRTL